MTIHANDAHPQPLYNARFRLIVPLLDADGDPVSPSAPDTELSQDMNTFADATNEATEIATSSGVVYIDLIATELDTTSTAVRVQSTGAKTTIAVLNPRRLPVIRTGTAQAGAATTITLDSGASAIDDYYVGCYVNCTNDTPTNVLGQARMITDYAGSTKVATVATWGTNPSSSTTFEILATELWIQRLADINALLGTAIATPTVAGVPEVDATHWRGTVLPSEHTAGYPIVTIKDGTGTGEINTNAGAVALVDAVTTVNGLASGVITATAIADNAIDAGALAADAITAAKIADGAIDAATFAAGAINAAAIATGAIDADAIAADAATEIRSLVSGTSDSGGTTTMIDAARTEADTDYWKGSYILFTSGNILGQCRLITAFDPATDTITFAPATTQAVATQTYEIIPSARADVHLWLGALVNALISGKMDANTQAMAANVITSSIIATDAIGAAQIAASAITSSEFADGTITSTKFGAGAIDNAAFNVTETLTANPASGGIVAASFGAGAIDSAAIATGAIDADAIAADAITAAKIATGAIDADALAADAVAEIRSVVSGTSDSGSTTTMIDAARTEADADYWKGNFILFTSGVILGQCRLITGFDPATDTITFAPATTQAVGTQTYEVLPAARVDLQLWLGSVANVLVSGRVDANVGAISGDATAADNEESFFDGVGYAGTNNVIPTVTTVGTVTNLTNAPTAGDLTAAMKASVNVEVLDVLNTDTFAEPGQEAPPATTTLVKKLGWLYKAFRNRITQTATTLSIYNDNSTTVDAKSTVSDSGTTYDKGEITSGP